MRILGSMRRRLLALLAALSAVALLGAPASAHEQDPHVVTLLDQVIPRPAGVDIEVKQSLVPELVVANPTPTMLEVLNATGRPFLRIGPGGVFADFATPDWYTTNSPIGVADIPAFAQAPTAAPRWVNISPEPSWGWFDHRMHPVPIASGPPQVAGITQLSRWIVPLTYGTERVEVLGHLSWVSLQGQFRQMLTSSRTPFPGTTVDVLEGRLPGFLVTNGGTTPVTIQGRAGEPFARVGPAGVEVNLHSPTWIDQLQFQNRTPSAAADPAAPPQWQQESTAPRFDWLDTRAQYRALTPPAAAYRTALPTVLLRWSIPLDEGSATRTVQGVTSYVPYAPATGGGAGGSGGGGRHFPMHVILTVALVALGAGIIAVGWIGMPRRLRPWRGR